MASRLRVYGESLLHPIALIALSLWAINDHYGKGTWPNWLSGKVSDVCCLIVIPILCSAGVELISRVRGKHLATARAWGVLVGDLGAALAAIIMVGINLWPSWAHVYEVGLGAIQWLALIPFNLMRSRTIGEPYLVNLTMDPSDLITIPAALLGPWINRQCDDVDQ